MTLVDPPHQTATSAARNQRNCKPYHGCLTGIGERPAFLGLPVSQIPRLFEQTSALAVARHSLTHLGRNPRFCGPKLPKAPKATLVLIYRTQGAKAHLLLGRLRWYC
jgi:hypothetical protein